MNGRRESRIPPGVYPSPAPRHHQPMTHFALRPFVLTPLFLHRENLPWYLPFPPWDASCPRLSYGNIDGAIPTENDVGCDKKGVEHVETCETACAYSRVELESRVEYRENLALEEIVRKYWNLFTSQHFSPHKYNQISHYSRGIWRGFEQEEEESLRIHLLLSR